MGRDYTKLIAWQKADELVMKIYQETKHFPREEIYGLTSQLRRAVLSVPTNIAEGMGRQTQKDRAHFMVLAGASLAEVGYLVDVAHRLGYMQEDAFNTTIGLHDEISRVLYGLTRKIREEQEISQGSRLEA
jgi:four helix bundle protein